MRAAAGAVRAAAVLEVLASRSPSPGLGCPALEPQGCPALSCCASAHSATGPTGSRAAPQPRASLFPREAPGAGAGVAAAEGQELDAGAKGQELDAGEDGPQSRDLMPETCSGSRQQLYACDLSTSPPATSQPLSQDLASQQDADLHFFARESAGRSRKGFHRGRSRRAPLSKRRGAPRQAPASSQRLLPQPSLARTGLRGWPCRRSPAPASSREKLGLGYAVLGREESVFREPAVLRAHRHKRAWRCGVRRCGLRAAGGVGRRGISPRAQAPQPAPQPSFRPSAGRKRARTPAQL